MTPIEKIQLLSMKTFRPTMSQCRDKKMELRKNRDAFVERVIKNIMIDGLVVRCKK